MKKTVKSLVVFTCVCLFAASLSAQLKLPTGGALAADLKKVIADYPNRFNSMRGELIAENPQTAEYVCTFRINGAAESRIIQYSSATKVCSWEALLLSTENFDKARQKYRSLFQQLNNLSASLGQDRNIHFKGRYEAPAEESKFSSVLFESDAPVAAKLKMELTLEFHAPMEWQVKVLLYDREREDHERGREKETGDGG